MIIHPHTKYQVDISKHSEKRWSQLFYFGITDMGNTILGGGDIQMSLRVIRLNQIGVMSIHAMNLNSNRMRYIWSYPVCITELKNKKYCTVGRIRKFNEKI
jgi:hypothetical protein